MSNKLSPVVVEDTHLSTLATFKERLCRPFCIDSSVQPQVTVTYSNRTPKFNGSTVFVPISAVITIVSPECPCRAKVQLFTENFIVAFQGQTGLPKSVRIESAGRVTGGADVHCGCAYSYRIDDSLAISITSGDSAYALRK